MYCGVHHVIIKVSNLKGRVNVIYTRFGVPVEITGGNVEKGEVDFIKDGTVFKSYIRELKADDGFNEIENAIKVVNAVSANA